MQQHSTQMTAWYNRLPQGLPFHEILQKHLQPFERSCCIRQTERQYTQPPEWGRIKTV